MSAKVFVDREVQTDPIDFEITEERELIFELTVSSWGITPFREYWKKFLGKSLIGSPSLRNTIHPFHLFFHFIGSFIGIGFKNITFQN
jgi:hypothetical protein